MSSDIRDILHKLAALEESQLTPVSVKHGLNPQQKKADQLPALFKPKNISPTLSKAPYQEHPMKGKLVGDSVEPKKTALEEAMQEVEEDMLSKVKATFADYLERLEDENKVSPRLVRKAKAELNIDDDPQTEEDYEPDMTGDLEHDIAKNPGTALATGSALSLIGMGENATWDADVAPPSDPADSEVAHGVEDHIAAAVAAPAEPMGHVNESPVATYAMEDGSMLECYGDDDRGYEIRRGNRILPARFKSPGEADIAVKLFQQRRKKQQDPGQDYLEER